MVRWELSQLAAKTLLRWWQGFDRCKRRLVQTCWMLGDLNLEGLGVCQYG